MHTQGPGLCVCHLTSCSVTMTQIFCVCVCAFVLGECVCQLSAAVACKNQLKAENLILTQSYRFGP